MGKFLYLSIGLSAATCAVGNSLMVSGAGGIPDWTYYILASTNLASAQWTVIATNQFDASGNFTFTTPLNPTAPQTFHKTQLQ